MIAIYPVEQRNNIKKYNWLTKKAHQLLTVFVILLLVAFFLT